MGEFAKLDPLLHSELRLAIMSTLLTMEEADFVYLREATGATAGNLSVQIDKRHCRQSERADRQALRGGVHHCRERICGEEAEDGVQDNGDGSAGFRGLRRSTKVVSALSADKTSLLLFYPTPNPFRGRGFGRSRSWHSLILLLLRKESKGLTTTTPNRGKCCRCGKRTKDNAKDNADYMRYMKIYGKQGSAAFLQLPGSPQVTIITRTFRRFRHLRKVLVDFTNH